MEANPPTRRRVRGFFRCAFGFVFRHMSIGKSKTFPLLFPDRPKKGVPGGRVPGRGVSAGCPGGGVGFLIRGRPGICTVLYSRLYNRLY